MLLSRARGANKTKQQKPAMNWGLRRFTWISCSSLGHILWATLCPKLFPSSYSQGSFLKTHLVCLEPLAPYIAYLSYSLVSDITTLSVIKCHFWDCGTCYGKVYSVCSSPKWWAKSFCLPFVDKFQLTLWPHLDAEGAERYFLHCTPPTSSELCKLAILVRKTSLLFLHFSSPRKTEW